MAEVEITPKQTSDSGVKPEDKGELKTEDTHLIPNDGNTRLRVVNGGAEALTVTIATPGSTGGLAIADRTVEVPAGEERIIGPFKKSLYNNEDEQIEVTIDKSEEVTISAIKG